MVTPVFRDTRENGSISTFMELIILAEYFKPRDVRKSHVTGNIMKVLNCFPQTTAHFENTMPESTRWAGDLGRVVTVIEIIETFLKCVSPSRVDAH